MDELLTSAQMRAIEREAIATGAVTGLELMERAGAGVVAAIFETWPALASAPGRAVVLCGPGNNGGDGFVVARLLAGRGWTVEVALLGQAERLPPDAAANCARWCETGTVRPLEDAPEMLSGPPPALVVDALFGTGLTRPVGGVAARILGQVAEMRARDGVRVVAVDIPSGICADSGRVLGSFAPADLTVSFHAEKLGHCLGAAARHSRKVVVKDIGLPHEAGPEVVRRVAPPAPSRLAKGEEAHKYDHGHVMVLSGGPGRSGAARLAARGALRVGAGLVTLGTPPAALAEVAAQVTAIMLRPVAGAGELSALLEDRRFNAIALGPGLGLKAGHAALVAAALATGRGAVLDADALTLVARDAALFAALHGGCVLTPHGGEFRRLFPDIAERLDAPALSGPAFSTVDAVRAAAMRAGCAVLLKGAVTVIAGPEGQCAVLDSIRDRAAPWLATAGAGDVLAGMIAGLRARGLAPMPAAEAAAWLHAAAARRFGPGLIAEDLPEALPAVLRDLGL